MPSCFLALGSVRTRQKHQSARCAPEVQIFWPLTSQWSPLSSQRSAATPGRSPRPAPRSPGTSAARPSRSAGCGAAAAPRCRTRAGSGRTCRRPCRRSGWRADRAISASTRASAGDQAAAAVGRRPGGRAPALLAHPPAPQFGVCARGRRGLRIHRGIRVDTQRGREVRLDPAAHLSAKRFRLGAEVSHRLPPAGAGVGLGRLGQAQDALGDDVVLHLVGAAGDGAGLAAEPGADGETSSGVKSSPPQPRP
jgi:hypothetical protein